MESNKRLILTVILCLAIALGFHFLYPIVRGEPPRLPPDVAGGVLAADGGAARVADADAGVAPVVAAPSVDGGVAATPPVPSPAPAGPAPEALPEQRVTLSSDQVVLGLSSHGAGLVQAELLGKKNERPGRGERPQVDLAASLGPQDPRLFELQLGGGLPPLPRNLPCAVVESSATDVRFRCDVGTIALEKRFTLGTYPEVDLAVTLLNQGAQAVEGTLELLVPVRVDPTRQHGGSGCGNPLKEMPMPTQAICRHGDDVSRHMFDAEKPKVKPEGVASWGGFDERYFIALAVPVDAAGGASCELAAPSQELVQATVSVPTGMVPPGGAQTRRFALVLGPKDLGVLQETSKQIAAAGSIADPQLGTTIDFGLWAVIARVLLAVMKFFHLIIPNWGVAIILLTVTVKIATFPLAWKSMKSMEEMRKLAPEIELLKKKHGEDKEKLNVEMLGLYQKHKVNPLGGCLPMLIQMPIWIALYTTLQTSFELYNEAFIPGWLNDLTTKDPFYVLPLVMGATMFITQKMQPATTMDPTQQKMLLYFMPVMFTAFMLQLPSGLTLYIFTNNILSIAQQLALRKVMGVPLVGAAAPASAAPAGEGRAGKDKGRKR